MDPFYKIIENVGVIVYDSPGLQGGAADDDDYLDKVYKRCTDLDLVIFAIRMENRFVLGDSNPDVKTMVKFSRYFGHSIWSKSIVIITCANLAENLYPDIMSENAEEKRRFFTKLMSDYEEAIHDTLQNKAGIPADIVKKVKVIPAGHKSKSLLMDGTPWFTTFWLECLTAFSSIEACVSMIKTNVARIKAEPPSTSQDGKLVYH